MSPAEHITRAIRRLEDARAKLIGPAPMDQLQGAFETEQEAARRRNSLAAVDVADAIDHARLAQTALRTL